VPAAFASDTNQEKAPPDVPACHDDVGDSEVAANVPESDDPPDSTPTTSGSASTIPGSDRDPPRRSAPAATAAGTSTSPDTRRATESLRETTRVPCRHCGRSGVTAAHDGNTTNPNRAAQSPPTAEANPP